MANLSYANIYGDTKVFGDTNLLGLALKNGIEIASINDNVASASKLLDARTISITGDGSGSVNFDGTGNVSIPLVINNNSHEHTNYLLLSGGTMTGDITLGSEFIYGVTTSRYLTLGNTPTLMGPSNVVIQADSDGSSTSEYLMLKAGNNELKLKSSGAGTGTQILTLNDNKVFNDLYHPRADRWTTARTLSLTGDVTGSVSIDGSGNVSMTTVVGNDTHSHDFLYYTKAIADGRYIPFNGNSTLTGNLVITGNLTVQGDATEFQVTDLSVEDNIITVAKNNTGTSPFGGLKFERGASDAYLVYQESDDRWKFLYDGDEDLSNGTFANVQAGTFYGALSGNASTASKWATSRTLTLTGDVAGSVSMDGSGNVSMTTTVASNSHDHDKYLETAGGTVTGDLRVDGQLKFGTGGQISFNETEKSIDFIII